MAWGIMGLRTSRQSEQGVKQYERNGFDEYACLRELEWDTKYFGLACAKAVLYKPLTIDCWNELKRSFRQYQFVCIENRNSEPINAQLIGRDTSAFLADVNIQFLKED